jgi:hypothetical protein
MTGPIGIIRTRRKESQSQTNILAFCADKKVIGNLKSFNKFNIGKENVKNICIVKKKIGRRERSEGGQDLVAEKETGVEAELKAYLSQGHRHM